ncbi:MAG: pyrophosphatase [Bacteroidetes bacterium]|jgi:NTP pyrophosphatase (non-canonical NTP hydrolase)|nr:pyrophosphatase [Bacteroidota bacterium]
MTLQEAQEAVDKWINEYGVRYFNELTNLGILMEEVGETARIITRKYGEQSDKQSDKGSNLSDELSDILFVLICIANQTDIDLTTAFKNNLLKKSDRDKERHKNNDKLK